MDNAQDDKNKIESIYDRSNFYSEEFNKQYKKAQDDTSANGKMKFDKLKEIFSKYHNHQLSELDDLKNALETVI